MPFSLVCPAHHELVIKKSRFIACVESVAGRDEAQARVAQLKAEHPDAAHVCWALLAGGQSAAHDDGEPGGTAGRPMLEVLRHQDLQGVMASVVRYFGGVKLGAGGLVRAYTDAVAQALLTAEKIPLIKQAQLACSVVTLRFALPDTLAAALMARLSESGRGQLVWLDGDTSD
jgi:uncharacterized YigZ family protein